MIDLATVSGRIELRINLEAAKTAGLVIDSRLLRLAQVAKAR